MNGTLLFRKNDPDVFWKLWDEITRLTKAGPRYAQLFIQSSFAVAEERGLEDDRSFILIRDGKPCAAALVPIGKREDERAITFSGGYVEVPLVVDPSIRADVFDLIDRFAQEANVLRALYALDPAAPEPYNYLQRLGFLDTSLLTYAYDLTKSGDPMEHCRRNHVRSLKRLLNDPRISVVRVDADAPNRAHHDAYELLHEKCSGRKTRSKRTFDLQYEQLLAGEAVLFGILLEGKPVAYGYFQHANGHAIYGSTSDDPDVQGFAFNHLLTLEGMRYYRERHYVLLFPGDPSCPSPQFDFWPDVKQLQIAHFKNGFGGDYRALFRGIKYYDAQSIATDAERFARGYAASWEHQRSLHADG